MIESIDNEETETYLLISIANSCVEINEANSHIMINSSEIPSFYNELVHKVSAFSNKTIVIGFVECLLQPDGYSCGYIQYIIVLHLRCIEPLYPTIPQC